MANPKYTIARDFLAYGGDEKSFIRKASKNYHHSRTEQARKITLPLDIMLTLYPPHVIKAAVEAYLDPHHN